VGIPPIMSKLQPATEGLTETVGIIAPAIGREGGDTMAYARRSIMPNVERLRGLLAYSIR
jgi:hypothetical protein